MIKHIVLFKLKENDEKIKKEIVDRLLSMNGKIDGLLKIESGVNFLKAERNYDIGLICDFRDQEAFENYKDHPVHVPVLQFMKPYIEISKAVDYEV